METDTHDRVPCPSCTTPLDMSTSLRLGRSRRPGDFSICSGCSEVLRFTDDLQLHLMTPADWLQVRADPHLHAFLLNTQAWVQDDLRRRGGD